MPGVATPGFSGPRLREAREARGLTAASIAEVLGVKRQAVSQYEHGLTAPTPDKLYVIASRLNLPVRYFLQTPRAPVERTVFFRSQAAATKAERTKAERRLEWLEDLVAYLRSFVEFPVVSFPTDLDLGHELDAPWSSAAIEEAAMALRTVWNLGNGPVSNVVGVLERQGGIATRGIVETESIDAFSVRLVVEDRPAFFLGADKDSASRSRFDAAHELAHHVLHRRMRPKRLMNAQERKAVEQEAHRFASAFLLPASEFARDLRAPTLGGMVVAKARWRVSVGAMIQRCVDLEILREDEAQRLWVARAKRGWSRHEPLDDAMPIESPAILRDAVELLISEGVRTPEQIVEDLPFEAADIEALTGLPSGRLAHEDAPIQLLSRRSEPVPAAPLNGAQVIDFRAGSSAPERP
jgi:Zn-dependent peptidase ImmA (M78 family)/transcriptional regulator with XRE-family HTH domain